MKYGVDEHEDGEIRSDTSDSIGQLGFFKRTFRSFNNPTFRLYYGALLGQMAAMNMQMVARSYLVYHLTGSPVILGLLTLAATIPMLILSLFGGIIADRVHKKYVMLIGQASSAVVSLGVALTLTLGYLSPEHADSWWILILAAVLQGIIMGLMMPSRQAFLPEIVGGKQLMNAISLNVMAMNTLRLLAPAAAGFLIDAFDFQAVYYAMTGMYLMAVVFVAFLPLTRTLTSHGTNALTDIKEGINYIRHETNILLVLVFTLFAVILSMPYMMLLPVFAVDILNVGATGMGILVSVSGVGAIIGSIILASLPNKKRGLMLLAGGLLLGLALTGFSFSSSWYLSLGLIAIVGLGQTTRMSLSNTLVQYYVEDKYRGRVMSIYMMEFGLMGIGVFGAGLLAEAIGIQWAVGGFAMVLAFVSILALVFLPRIRKLD
ncbi:MFS transporter [Chloroflexota bacterium]